MTSRLAKTLLVAASAFYYTLVVFNNLTDYASKYQFVRVFLIEGVVLILLAIPGPETQVLPGRQ